jgi:hypothetical protein
MGAPLLSQHEVEMDATHLERFRIFTDARKADSPGAFSGGFAACFA